MGVGREGGAGMGDKGRSGSLDRYVYVNASEASQRPPISIRHDRERFSLAYCYRIVRTNTIRASSLVDVQLDCVLATILR